MGQIKNIKLHIVTDIKFSPINSLSLSKMADTEPEMIRDEILDTEEMRKLFVGGIAKDATDEEFKEFFETQCGGEVSDAVIIRKDNDKKNHFGFVTFAQSELIDNLLLKKADLSFKGRSLDVNRAVPKSNTSEGAHSKTKKLFIANVPKTGVTDDDLKAYFEKRHPKEFGTIESVQLIKVKDKEGNKLDENKGFGFVTVSSEDMADKMSIQHASFEFGGRKIELKKSSPPGEGGGRGGRGGRGRGAARGGGHFPGGYGGYGGYGGQWDYSGGYGGYGGGYDY